MDQPTSAEAKNPSLNIHAGCIKVVDTLRRALGDRADVLRLQVTRLWHRTEPVADTGSAIPPAVGDEPRALLRSLHRAMGRRRQSLRRRKKSPSTKKPEPQPAVLVHPWVTMYRQAGRLRATVAAASGIRMKLMGAKVPGLIFAAVIPTAEMNDRSKASTGRCPAPRQVRRAPSRDGPCPWTSYH